MQRYNVIIVYDIQADNILMCKRKKEPYKGLYNLVGGKIELDEDGLQSAYRELFEETGVSKNNITLHHLMDFTYHIWNCYIEVYVGRLKQEVTLIEEANELLWIDTSNNFFDKELFAGEGNIGHMIEQVKKCMNILLNI